MIIAMVTGSVLTISVAAFLLIVVCLPKAKMMKCNKKTITKCNKKTIRRNMIKVKLANLSKMRIKKTVPIKSTFTFTPTSNETTNDRKKYKIVINDRCNVSESSNRNDASPMMMMTTRPNYPQQFNHSFSDPIQQTKQTSDEPLDATEFDHLRQINAVAQLQLPQYGQQQLLHPQLQLPQKIQTQFPQKLLLPLEKMQVQLEDYSIMQKIPSIENSKKSNQMEDVSKNIPPKWVQSEKSLPILTGIDDNLYDNKLDHYHHQDQNGLHISQKSGKTNDLFLWPSFSSSVSSSERIVSILRPKQQWDSQKSNSHSDNGLCTVLSFVDKNAIPNISNHSCNEGKDEQYVKRHDVDNEASFRSYGFRRLPAPERSIREIDSTEVDTSERQWQAKLIKTSNASRASAEEDHCTSEPHSEHSHRSDRQMATDSTPSRELDFYLSSYKS